MTKIYGTSHIAQESIDLIEEKIENEDPDIVALELDMQRLHALLTEKEETNKDAPLFIKLLKKFQEKMSAKTGIIPGEEMLTAYHQANEKDLEIALIDQDIRITIQRLREEVGRKEKFKAVISMALAFILPGKFDLNKIPEDEVIDELTTEFQKRYPKLFQVLVTERNQVMAEALHQLELENPDKKIIAFVGAAHKEEVKKLLEEKHKNQSLQNHETKQKTLESEE